MLSCFIHLIPPSHPLDCSQAIGMSESFSYYSSYEAIEDFQDSTLPHKKSDLMTALDIRKWLILDTL